MSLTGAMNRRVDRTGGAYASPRGLCVVLEVPVPEPLTGEPLIQ